MIHTFDLHDRAYYVWRDAGVRDATLVHIDAHHDAAVEPAWKAIDIGNFVRAGMRHGLVQRMLWVVPDPMWEHGTRDILELELDDITQPDDRIWMGPLRRLPPHDGPLLQDIDLDYLVTVAYDDGRTAEPRDCPWIAPEALARAIGDPRLRARARAGPSRCFTAGWAVDFESVAPNRRFEALGRPPGAGGTARAGRVARGGPGPPPDGGGRCRRATILSPISLSFWEFCDVRPLKMAHD